MHFQTLWEHTYQDGHNLCSTQPCANGQASVRTPTVSRTSWTWRWVMSTAKDAWWGWHAWVLHMPWQDCSWSVVGMQYPCYIKWIQTKTKAKSQCVRFRKMDGEYRDQTTKKTRDSCTMWAQCAACIFSSTHSCGWVCAEHIPSLFLCSL